MTTTSLDTLDLIRVMENQIVQCQQMNTLDEEYVGLLQESKEKYQDLCKQTDYLQKKIIMMKRENTNLMKTQQRLETQVYAQDQELQGTKKQITTLCRRNKDLETRLELELKNYEADRLSWHQTEMELTSAIKKCSSLNNSLNPRRTRSATASNVFHAPSSKIIDDRNNFCHHPSSSSSSSFIQSEKNDHRQKFNLAKIQAQERLLANLQSELETQKLSHLEAIQEQSDKLASVVKELQDIKELNRTLMEDNEGYQMLLTEKTMSGAFLKKVEQEQPFSLATEIGRMPPIHESSIIQELTDENKTLKESNKALSLYMNKILLKIVGNHELVDVLNIDEEEPGKDRSPSPPVVRKPDNTSSKPQPRERRSTISCFRQSKDQGWTKALKRMTVMGWNSSSNSSSSSSSSSSESSNNSSSDDVANATN
ncbi:uncharacterized protein BX664DRAFT_386999 [Halteromyces radiatus]|uniref:uncharacterized protein n=1 Tax=Halteromyces radiatus TaxID=101107 RepID=UPI00221F0A66|nr:uncharacterized protein BX664DRAFT_386999 [Halteromyces radiatus]KAI8086607.1 hypothetical protein BX664DRAFT_386999 [Halteromyces radiatus]